MLKLLHVLLLPFVLSNLISPAYCGELGGDNGTTSAVIDSRADTAATSNSTAIATATSVRGSIGSGTCPGRTANYITHTLPQQCLRTDRAAANATHNGTVSHTPAASATFNSDTNTSISTLGTGEQVRSSSTTDTAVNASSTATPETTSSTISSTTTAEAEAENDSPLDNANFLSFEEWKKQNLAKSGQSPENVGNGRNIEGMRERPINNALESYGEEGEIDLDFSGFGGQGSAPRSSSRESQTGTSSVDVPVGELIPALRSKDAGKTCKERTNYASFDCAANVLKSNSECKSSSSVLVENKDSYMLNTCSVKNKYFIIELCDDILIDTIVLANYEFFSSMFRHFRVSVSDRYPVKIDKWKELGTFEARNVRDVQAFLVERPQIWARYLRIEFLSHYGSEYYCPVSLLRVHGTTMLEDYRHQEEVARGDHAEEATLEVEVNATPALAQEPITSTDESSKETATSIESVSMSETSLTEPSASSHDANATNSSSTDESAPTSPMQNSTFSLPEMLDSTSDNLTCPLNRLSNDATMPETDGLSKGNASTDSNSMDGRNTSSSVDERRSATGIDSHTNITVSATSTSSPPRALGGESSFEKDGSSTAPASTSKVDLGTHASFTNTSATVVPSHQSSMNSSLIASSPSALTASTNTTRQSPASSTATPSPQPATQESFYKSVHKRLQQLESNSTLSLQYIEEQSRILRDAFSKVEKRQIAATTSFLTNLNTTVMAELQGFRQAYDQLWQSTVIELEGQREQYQREMLAMGSRLTLVADELVWQKRMGIVQSTLLLLCLSLVLFARQGNGYLEMPLMQQMVHRSQSALARAGWESPPASPHSPSSRSPVSLFRRKLWRSHTEPVGSGDVTDATDSRPESKDGPEVVVAPPTPPDKESGHVADRSYDGSAVADESDGGEADADVDDEAFEDVWESRSGPATPRGTREGSLSEFSESVGWLDPGASGAGILDAVESR